MKPPTRLKPCARCQTEFPPPAHGDRYCPLCKEYRARPGACAKCFDADSQPGSKFCGPCLTRGRERSAAYAQRLRDRVCLCGKPLADQDSPLRPRTGKHVDPWCPSCRASKNRQKFIACTKSYGVGRKQPRRSFAFPSDLWLDAMRCAAQNHMSTSLLVHEGLRMIINAKNQKHYKKTREEQLAEWETRG